MRAAMILSWCYPRIVSLPFAKGRIGEGRYARQMRKAERCAVTHPCFQTNLPSPSHLPAIPTQPKFAISEEIREAVVILWYNYRYR